MSTADKRILFWSFIVIVLAALAPAISAFSAFGIAGALGCSVSEAGASPCLIGGADIGGILAVMVVIGWFGLMTLPAGALALVAWAIGFAVLWWRGRKA